MTPENFIERICPDANIFALNIAADLRLAFFIYLNERFTFIIEMCETHPNRMYVKAHYDAFDELQAVWKVFERRLNLCQV